MISNTENETTLDLRLFKKRLSYINPVEKVFAHPSEKVT